MSKTLKKAHQVRLLETILKLSESGLPHRDMAQQLIRYGSKHEKTVGEHCVYQLSEGKRLSEGLRPYIEKTAYLALLSGEDSGHVSMGLSDALDSLKLNQASSVEIVKALIKPILWFLCAVSIAALMSKYAFPTLSEQLPKAKWWAISRSADNFGQFWLDYGLWLAGVLVIVCVTVSWSLSRFTGPARMRLDNWPIYRQYRLIHCTNFLTAIAHQLSVGTSLKRALLQYQSQSSAYVGYHINVMLGKISEGEHNVGLVFDTQLLMPQDMDMLKILGKTGEPATVLKQSATRHAEKITRDLDWLKGWGARGVFYFAIVIVVWLFLGLMLLAMSIAMNF